MKIQISGYHNPNYLTVTEYIEKAFNELGHKVYSFDDRKHIFPGRVRKKIKLFNRLSLWNINRKFISLAVKNSPDIAIVTGGHRISNRAVEFLKKQGVFAVLWTTDAPHEFEPILKCAHLYNKIFCQGSEAVDILIGNGIKNVELMPMACDPNLHFPQILSKTEKKDLSTDIVFVGSYYPNRWEVFKNITDVKFSIWGPGWSKVKNETRKNFKISELNLTVGKWSKIYSAAKIVIVIHFQDGHTPCHQASPKVFEALACKALVIVDRQRDVLNLFEDGKDLVTFKDIQDLKQKIEYYLDNPDDAQKIAVTGFNTVKNYHTYKERITELMDSLQPLFGNKNF